MFNPIPFTGTRREVADRYAQPGLIRQPLQLELPQPQPRSIAAARVRRDQQPAGPRILRLARRMPPAANRLHGKRGRVVIDPHAHPSAVVRQVVDSVGGRTPQFFNPEIMHTGCA